MKSDLTVIYLTSNKLPERWVDFHQEKLVEAVGKHRLLSFSQVPIGIGENTLQDYGPSKANIFWQMLRGAKMANTEYVAVAEDDTLYPVGHFDFARGDAIFNQHRWSLYSWNPVYSLKNFIRTNATFIGKTETVIKVLEARFAEYPMGSAMPPEMSTEIGLNDIDKALGVRIKDVKSLQPVVQVDHDYFTPYDTSKESVERRHQKKLGVIQAYDIPYWRRAEEITRLFQ